jgi:hypothetical protein
MAKRKLPSPKDIALGKRSAERMTEEDVEASVPRGDDEGDPDPTDSLAGQRGAPERKPREVQFTDDELKKLGDEFSTVIRDELSGRSNKEQDWLRYQRLYASQPKILDKTYPMQGASNIIVPLSRIYCDTIVARIMQSIFAIQPHWTATELNRKFAPAVKPMERWLDWCRENVWNQYKVVKPLVQETVKLGTSVLYNGWRDETKFRYDDKSKQTVPASRVYGPWPQWVPREDFICPTGYSDVQASPFVAQRIWMSWDRARQLEHSGYLENLDELRGVRDEETELRRLRRDATGGDFQLDERFGLLAFWNVWFQRDFDGDGWPEEYIMLLHEEHSTIHRLKANPFPSQMRPFVVTRFVEQEGEFDGIGIPEMVEPLQEEASTIHNQRRDSAHLSLITMFIGSAASNLPDTIRPAQGKVIKALSTQDLKEFHPTNPTQIAAYEEQFVNALADRTVGVSELNDGRMTSPVGRAAATTVMALLQEGARRFDLNTSEIRMALSEEAHQIAELYQTYGLPEPEMTGSPEQVLDEQDAVKVRELLQIQDNLRNFMAIKLNVSTQAVNREVEKQSTMQLYQAATQHLVTVFQMAGGIVQPNSPPEIKQATARALMAIDEAFSKVLQSYSAFDMDNVLIGEVFAQMANKPQPPQQQPAAEPGGAPEQGGPAPAAPAANGGFPQ